LINNETLINKYTEGFKLLFDKIKKGKKTKTFFNNNFTKIMGENGVYHVPGNIYLLIFKLKIQKLADVQSTSLDLTTSKNYVKLSNFISEKKYLDIQKVEKKYLSSKTKPNYFRKIKYFRKYPSIFLNCQRRYVDLNLVFNINNFVNYTLVELFFEKDKKDRTNELINQKGLIKVKENEYYYFRMKLLKIEIINCPRVLHTIHNVCKDLFILLQVFFFNNKKNDYLEIIKNKYNLIVQRDLMTNYVELFTKFIDFDLKIIKNINKIISDVFYISRSENCELVRIHSYFIGLLLFIVYRYLCKETKKNFIETKSYINEICVGHSIFLEKFKMFNLSLHNVNEEIAESLIHDMNCQQYNIKHTKDRTKHEMIKIDHYKKIEKDFNVCDYQFSYIIIHKCIMKTNWIKRLFKNIFKNVFFKKEEYLKYLKIHNNYMIIDKNEKNKLNSIILCNCQINENIIEENLENTNKEKILNFINN
jgi:hypothetical protein